jgi:hypothetical protein
MWNLDHVHESLVAGLSAFARQCEAEQSVRGLDALDEVSLHPLLAGALSRPTQQAAVLREACFPIDPATRALRRDRDRCDLVLLPEGFIRLRDENDEAREQDRWGGSLFEQSPARDSRPEPAQPQDALWIEVKLVAQHAYVHGVPGPNAAYASELTRSITMDARKLARQPAIAHACLALVLFTSDEATASHDVPIALMRAMDAGARVRTPLHRGFAIADRIGNAWCGVWLIPVMCGEPSEQARGRAHDQPRKPPREHARDQPSAPPRPTR